VPKTDRSADVHWLAAFMATALAYVLAGWAAGLLTIPPGIASPLFPAAGVALASVLIAGPRMLVGVVLGSFCLNVLLGPALATLTPERLMVTITLACGAALQAQAGGLLVRRFVRSPLTLSEPRDVAMFFVAATMSSLVNSSWSTTALWVAGRVSADNVGFNWVTWWVGDLLGMLIATPVVLTLFGRPREAWAPRRWSVGFTLTLVTLVLALGVAQILRWSNERLRNAFDRDASGASLAWATQLREPRLALEAMHSVYLANPDIQHAQWHDASRAWMDSGRLLSMGWVERVARADIAALETSARADGLAGFTVFDRNPAPGAALTAADDMLYVIRRVEPLPRSAAALGLNTLSVPRSGEALFAAMRSGKATASEAFTLMRQDGEATAHEGVVIFQAVYAAGATTHDAASVRGLLFVAVRMESILAGFATEVPRYLSLCLVDRTLPDHPTHVAGETGCESRSGSYVHVRPVDFGGRAWELRVLARRADVPGAGSADVWLFSLVSLLSAAVLGAFLLALTGRTRRIETAVRDRTAALESEMRERGMAEAALRESEQRFRAILDNAPIGMLYSDLGGRLIQTNPSLCELIGYSEQELMQMTPADYIHPEDRAEDEELTARLIAGEIPMYRRHKRYLSSAGATVWVRATVSLLRDGQGQPRHIVGVVENITEHLRLEEAEHARELAESSSRAKSEFLSRMSHELRTPLNAMLGFAQLLELDQRDPLAESQRPWVAQIQQAGWHLLEMINDVLDLSRIESGNLRLHTETLDLAELVSATLSMVEGEARHRGIGISQELAVDSLTVLGDATRVKQILTNLLTNAVKYNVDAGMIRITSHVADDAMTEITVSDTGMGMTPEQMAQLFEPFNRLGRERSAQQGTGIGLVISQRLAELMGGSLWVHSQPGKGSSFVLALPRVLDPDTVRSDLTALEAPPTDYHRRIVHYVEDNETNVEVMRGILAQRPQVEMHVSITGLDGLAGIRTGEPDLILLDMHLPDINGLELLRHVKSDPRSADIPVVVVSADALVSQIEAAFEAGASHYLTKPVSVAELLAVVDTLLERVETRFG
jgi:PAS domain S-box-containing protein